MSPLSALPPTPDFLQRLGELLAPNGVVPGPQVGSILFLVAILAVLYRPTWRIFGFVITIVHELGHAVASLLVGGRPQGITIHWDHSGDTRFLTSRFFLARLWVAWWGYPAPLLAGFGLLLSTLTGRAGLGLVLALPLLFFTVALIRNFTALFTIGLTTALALAAWFFLPAHVLALPMFFLGCLLMVGGFRSVWEVTRVDLSGEKDGSDPQMLSRLALLPPTLWSMTFAAFGLWLVSLLLGHLPN